MSFCWMCANVVIIVVDCGSCGFCFLYMIQRDWTRECEESATSTCVTIKIVCCIFESLHIIIICQQTLTVHSSHLTLRR